ncbi:TPA: hypothetical protein ACVU5U_003959 [Vibrio parahaemolyticus]|uniref:hypothetical protein n=1 Tax=Vibrio harveyi group TaxID=717610 RepID=UPI00215CE268|nr:hypothetical protein [Vibrio parahaemolyticus]HDY7465013.1 hypothetical protein [Vibrio vulnificus]MBE3875444.1 hypothetical protein [Vibrio parahaemolyticus]MCR9645918.1 hypothetical protein [Vibrio parahaemolyticus]MCR9799779.1 hypothetical protein [Vibrio parahaemolyticus]MDF4316097.1 hypothetical protein [Vibrio parahaemolyticus]
MTRTIEITVETYARLEKLAVGFDSPEAVINRLLDQAEGKPETKPTLMFFPEDETEFKRELIKTKEAEVVLYKVDGTREVSRWNANKLTESSNLRGNLWSGLLRNWKEKGIKKAEFSVLPLAVVYPDGDDDRVGLDKALSLQLNLTYEEMQSLEYEVHTNESDDGLVYGHYVEIDIDNSDPEVLAKAEIDDDNYSFEVDLD